MPQLEDLWARKRFLFGCTFSTDNTDPGPVGTSAPDLSNIRDLCYTQTKTALWSIRRNLDTVLHAITSSPVAVESVVLMPMKFWDDVTQLRGTQQSMLIAMLCSSLGACMC